MAGSLKRQGAPNMVRWSLTPSHHVSHTVILGEGLTAECQWSYASGVHEKNPVMVRLWRGAAVESVHRGAWVLADPTGGVIESSAEPNQVVFGRSSTKSLQALPLIESGAADRYRLGAETLALALASHSGEVEHVNVARHTLAAIGLDEHALGCGPQAPRGSADGTPGTRIMNNCSGKHAGFLAVSQHLGLDPADYLDPHGRVQTLVAEAVSSMAGLAIEDLGVSVDGCGAPTFRLPLAALATAVARVTNPAGLAPERVVACRRLTTAAAEHPTLVAGSFDRVCTDLIAATNGRLFAKIGAEAVYVVGEVGGDRALAVKIDDGAYRGMHPLLMSLLQRFDMLQPAELAELAVWASTERHNFDGAVIGRVEVADEAAR